jgi:hypothetical protein
MCATVRKPALKWIVRCFGAALWDANLDRETIPGLRYAWPGLLSIVPYGKTVSVTLARVLRNDCEQR